MSHTPSDSIPLNEQRRPRRRTRGDDLNRLLWAGLLILAGVVLLANQTGMLPRVGNADTWDWIMLGVGGLLVFSGFIRATVSEHERPSNIRIIIGLILAGLGISSIFGVDFPLLWPAALIVFGLYLFLRNLSDHSLS